MVTRSSEDLYLSWLKDLTGPLSGKYNIVLEQAFKVDFYERVPNDYNRATEGLALRDRYTRETGHTYNKDRECSFLEMMLALSERINTINYDHKQPDRSAYWFWKLVGNLRLLELHDDVVDPETEEDIRQRLIAVVERRYRRNGLGGLFPLKHTNRDQKTIEVWYQMHEWIAEVYD